MRPTGPVKDEGAVTPLPFQVQEFIRASKGENTIRAIGAIGALSSGHATSALIAGVSERSIMNQTGHRSVQMVRRYIRERSLLRDNNAGKFHHGPEFHTPPKAKYIGADPNCQSQLFACNSAADHTFHKSRISSRITSAMEWTYRTPTAGPDIMGQSERLVSCMGLVLIRILLLLLLL